MNKIDITFIQPPETAVTIDGTDYVIKPITMRVLPALLHCIEPAFDEITELTLSPSLATAARVLARQSGPVCEAIAICTGVKVETVQDMLPDRAAALLLICCEVNADFFGRAVPSLNAQANQVAPLLNGRLRALLPSLPKPATGESLSSSSPAPATATTIS